MTSDGQQPVGRSFGPVARTAGCLLMAVTVFVLLAGALVTWFFFSWHLGAQSRDHDSQAVLADSAERLRVRLEDADADGALTDREIAEALEHRSPRSLARDEGRTVVVVQVAGYDQARCYSYTALPTGTVTSEPLTTCPSQSPRAPGSVNPPVKGRQ
ncbi:hypothetical protein [Streptomyces sp. NBC_00588]|uniref:hypothetical protein n=1 Tax=Streptomyces sp. NBC_00588 TaxID=2975784 RepID=UPI002E8161B9|nr:hypothetical protein [Streptomyces sp. NBC_00588]WUB40343.1 hypothetical protein OHN38_37580 [Streptomyces sp. NBC_00588]